ncbi:MAG: hypothetical protein JSS76_02950 [Bacteroidetes bacterium]|nr:hypothetical protein [Bacteroidota bacterium]
MRNLFILSILFFSTLLLNSCSQCSNQFKTGNYRAGYEAGKSAKEENGSSSCTDTWLTEKEYAKQKDYLEPDKNCMCQGYEDGYNGKPSQY